MAADCATVRCAQGGYITCYNYPGKHLDGCGCACMCALKNAVTCVLHVLPGSTYNSTSAATRRNSGINQ